MEKILLTHVPKTASTSIRESVIHPQVPAHQIRQYQGMRKMLRDWSPFRYMDGHYPYGVAKFAYPPGRSRYFVMLRDPVERLLSFYHNITKPRDHEYTHTAHEEATSNGLLDFHRIPRYQNKQARMVAGLFFHEIGHHVSLNRWKPLVYRLARYNLLHRYEAYGLTERYEESARLFARKLGFTREPLEERKKVVPNRPTKKDLTSRQVRTLRRLNSIDVAVYYAAKAHFEEQLSGADWLHPPS